MKSKKLLYILAFILFLIFIVAFFFPKIIKDPFKSTPINSFEECAEAGNPILDSYPPQCNTKDGKHFTQDIGNELEKIDKITISNPRPNQKITSPIIIAGKARGLWFSEGVFPIKLVDSKDNVIGQSTAQAEGEWMTEGFVPYKATIKFDTKDTKGTLILEKDNPSGLPENSDELRIPVNF